MDWRTKTTAESRVSSESLTTGQRLALLSATPALVRGEGACNVIRPVPSGQLSTTTPPLLKRKADKVGAFAEVREIGGSVTDNPYTMSPTFHTALQLGFTPSEIAKLNTTCPVPRRAARGPSAGEP
jgi:hypothetical protein